MKNNTFKKTRVATSMALLLGTTSMFSAQAQEAEAAADESMEVIQVKGIRGSLMRSQDLKRNSSGVVDAISAEYYGWNEELNEPIWLCQAQGIPDWCQAVDGNLCQ